MALIQEVYNCVIYHWKADIFSILPGCVELWYVVYQHNYRHLTINIPIITVKFPILTLQFGWLSSNTWRIQGVHHCIVIRHGKAGIFSILMLHVELWYYVYWDKYGHFNCNYLISLQLKCLYLYKYTTY